MTSLADIESGLADWFPDIHRLARDPWWIIGSTAMSLLGMEVDVADIDLLTSARDADALRRAWSQRRVEVGPRAGDSLFRSRYSRFTFRPLPVEVMGDLEVNTATGWQPVRIGQARKLQLGGFELPVPTLAEQIRLLETFGRPKDHVRLRVLQDMASAESRNSVN